MPSAFGDLNGNGPQQVWIDVARTGQDWGANRTDYRAEVRYYGNGYGSWGGDWGWEANFGGFGVGGRFSIPSSQRNQQYQVLWSGTFSRFHDGEGWLGGFYCSAWIDTDHSSVATASQHHRGGTAPASLRSPRRRPPCLCARGLHCLLASAWTTPGRQPWCWHRGGSGPLAPRSRTAWTCGTTAARAATATQAGRDPAHPGTLYTTCSPAPATSAAGGRGPDLYAARPPGRGRAWDGSAFRNCKVRAWDGSQWRMHRVRAWDGSAWRNVR